MIDVSSRSEAWAGALAIAGLVVALDQSTKQLVVATVERGDPVDLPLGFEIGNVRNSGVAFGLLSGGKGLVLAFTLGTLALVLAYFGLHARRPGLWLTVGLLSGGALGNLADRVRSGSVIDFIDPPYWPAFNLADVAIVVGVATLAAILIARDGSDVRSP
jgi:signal peptidase II